MPLSGTTIARFFRDDFSARSPIYVVPERRGALVDQIRARLSDLEGVRLDSHNYLNEEQRKRFVLALSLEVPSDRPYRMELRFELRLDERNLLTVNYGQEKALVSSLEELVGLIASCRERLNRRQAQSSKRKKVRNLKAQAIVARLKQMAREERFDFCTETNERALKLYVKLSAAECCELQVPFKGFEATLPHLREAILSLCELHRRGLTFRVRSLAAYSGSRHVWVRHDSPA